MDHNRTDSQPMTLDELSQHMDIPKYRLMSWETFYPSISSSQGHDGQRLYSPDAIKLLKEVARLHYEEKMKVHEIRDILQAMHRDQRQSSISSDAIRPVIAKARAAAASSPVSPSMAAPQVVVHDHQLIEKIEDVRNFLKIMELGLSVQIEAFSVKNTD